MYNQIDSNRKKTVLFIILFVVFVSTIGFLADQMAQGGYAIFAFAFIFSILTSVFSYYYSDKIALKTSGARSVTREQELELYRVVENLCITSGLSQPKVFVIETEAMNAFATGRNPQNASLAVTRGLLNNLEKTELEGVIAHELSHIRNYDILVMTVVVVLAGTVSMLSNILLRGRFLGKGKKGDLGMVLMIAGLVFVILSPIVATLIKLAVSRKREFLADADGALLTRYPEGLAKALEKISTSSVMPSASGATAHLFIANPLKGSFSGLFSTHPPVEARIKALRAMIQ